MQRGSYTPLLLCLPGAERRGASGATGPEKFTVKLFVGRFFNRFLYFYGLLERVIEGPKYAASWGGINSGSYLITEADLLQDIA